MEMLQSRLPASRLPARVRQALAEISHECRSPLQAIIGYTELLEIDGRLEEEDRTYLEGIKSNTERLLRYMNGLLAVMKTHELAGLHEEVVSLRDCLQDVERVMYPRVEKKRQKLNISISADVPNAVFLDYEKFIQILVNLIGNANKYAPYRAFISVNCHFVDSALCVEVVDDGPGIPQIFQDRVFQPFVQLPSHQKEGVGLGLSIAKRLVELHGGKIWFESNHQVGRGCKACFTIPRAFSFRSIRACATQ